MVSGRRVSWIIFFVMMQLFPSKHALLWPALSRYFRSFLRWIWVKNGQKEVWNQFWQLEIVMDCYESLRGKTCFSSPSNNLHIALCSSEGPFRTNGLHQEVALASWNLRGFWARYLILKILSIQLPKQSRDLQLFESTGRGVAFHSFVRESKSYRIYQCCIILHIVIRRKRNFVQWIAFIWLCSTHFILSFQRL